MSLGDLAVVIVFVTHYFIQIIYINHLNLSSSYLPSSGSSHTVEMLILSWQALASLSSLGFSLEGRFCFRWGLQVEGCWSIFIFCVIGSEERSLQQMSDTWSFLVRCIPKPYFSFLVFLPYPSVNSIFFISFRWVWSEYHWFFDWVFVSILKWKYFMKEPHYCLCCFVDWQLFFQSNADIFLPNVPMTPRQHQPSTVARIFSANLNNWSRSILLKGTHWFSAGRVVLLSDLILSGDHWWSLIHSILNVSSKLQVHIHSRQWTLCFGSLSPFLFLQ